MTRAEAEEGLPAPADAPQDAALSGFPPTRASGSVGLSRLSGSSSTLSVSRLSSAPLPVPSCIVPITLRDLAEMKNHWSLPLSDPRRAGASHDLQPGETALFLFQTEMDRIPMEELTPLLAVANVKIFLLTTSSAESQAFFRRRVEVAGVSSSPELHSSNYSGSGHHPLQEGPTMGGEDTDLFPSSASAAPTPTSSQSTTTTTTQLTRSTQDALQDIFLLSTFKEIFPRTTFQNFFTPPTMVWWRCGGAPASHYSQYFHYEPDLPATLLSPELQQLSRSYGAILTLKTLTSTALLPCYTAFPPAYTPAHLHDLTAQRGDAEGYTMVMIGSSDCPPCRRVFQNAKKLWDALPSNTVLYKGDWYLAKELREIVDVQMIPFFILFENKEILRLPNPAPFDAATQSPEKRWKPLATLQDSNVDNIICFLHRYTVTLRFDEDF